jgi:hypothetical protein
MSADGTQKLLEEIDELYRQNPGGVDEIRERAKSFFTGKIFVSHTSADHEFCVKHIVPTLRQFGVWGHFYLNWKHGLPAKAYRNLVEYGLAFSKTVIIVASNNYLTSDWAKLEVQWTVRQKHPIIVCLLDDIPLKRIHPKLRTSRWYDVFSLPRAVIDFRHPDVAVGELDRLLHSDAFGPVADHTLGRRHS